MQLHQYILLLKVCFDVSFVAGTPEDPVSDGESEEASASSCHWAGGRNTGLQQNTVTTTGVLGQRRKKDLAV